MLSYRPKRYRNSLPTTTGVAHWTAVKRILCYLRGTRDFVPAFSGSIGLSTAFEAYCDADHANSPDHGRSISGYAILLGFGSFSWSAKKQMATAWSTVQAEHYASVHAGQEIAWLRQLLTEVGLPPSEPTSLRIDNASAICMIHATRRSHAPKVVYHCIRDANFTPCTFPG